MTNELSLSRQSRLVPIEKISQWSIKIYGVGSVGSNVTRTLAKTGFRDIEVFDMDTVDKENIAAQAFSFKHIKMNKVDAMKDIVLEETGIEITATHGQVTEESQTDAEPNVVYCCFFDSIDARKMLFNKLKEFPIIFVDGRIGGFNMRHYLIDCSNKKEILLYEKSINMKARSELQCGEKASAPINTELAGKIVSNIVSYISGRDYINPFMGCVTHPKNDIAIVKPGTGVEEEPETPPEQETTIEPEPNSESPTEVAEPIVTESSE